MNATELQQAKDAYINLTNYFIDNGLADVSNFAVISFSRNATLNANLTATQAISTIQGLTTASPLEGTKYNDALFKANQFFTQSPLKGVTNVAYFTSDGSSQNSDPTYHQDAINLRNVANVQAFGIYDSTDPATVSQSQLDFVDSDNSVILSNASQLQTTLVQSGLTSYLDRIEILQEGNVIETIQPNQLTDSPLGLTYEGTVAGLDVSLNAENLVTAKAYFTNGTPPTTLDFTVASGLEESTSDPLTNIIAGTPGNDEIFLNQIDLGAEGDAGNDSIVGNQYDNQLNGGDGNDTIYGYDGNDTIVTGIGINRVDGGDGVDTVVYADKLYASSLISKTGQIVNVDGTNSLTNVEFVQYSDFRVSTETLQVTPVLQGYYSKSEPIKQISSLTIDKTYQSTTTQQPQPSIIARWYSPEANRTISTSRS
jgi:Ca2+-binding RTX toxin-like protein